MNKKIQQSLLLLLLVVVWNAGMCQDRIGNLSQSLENLVVEQPGLDDRFDSSVSGVTLTQFIRALGVNHRINLWVDDSFGEIVVNSFADARVADVLIFLCKEYSLSMEFTGDIISIKRYIPEPKPIEVAPIRVPEVAYNAQTNFLSLDLKRDTLEKVAREITSQSMVNIILAPDVKDKIVSVYIQNRPMVDALEKLCFANDLQVTSDGAFYLISALKPESADNTGKNNDKKKSKSQEVDSEHLEIVLKDDKVTVSCEDVAITDVIDLVSREFLKNYFLYNEPEGRISLYVENATYEQFLGYILNGTKYTFKLQDKVYLIGERKLEGLRTTELVKLQNRTIEGVKAAIPQELQTDIDIKEFVELNAFILSGSYPKIQEIKEFIRQVDQVVPVITIEVLIVDVNKSRTMTTGINAGLGTPATETSGTLSPGVDVNLSTETINNLITSFNGMGVVNLGNVTPDFYLSIQALESDGVLRTRSTPKLSTLNGTESNLSIGRTEYYLETRNDIVGTQNPTISQQQLWKSVNADLSINIKPIVSSAEQVTLEITVTQTDFTERISATAPPGSVRRDFKSSIRVKNGEMVLLGGLEDKSVSSSGTGLPLIARIPIIKWFFGNRTKTNSNSKLNIFIRPTIIY
jgi:type IV pilus assembly protein PilQ